MEDVFKLAFVAHRINGGILDKKLSGKEWRCFVGDACYTDKKALTSFRDAINDLLVDDEESGLMCNPEEEFLHRRTGHARTTTPRKTTAP